MPEQKQKLVCAHCGDYDEDNLQPYQVDDEDVVLCESCYNSETTICYRCKGVYRDGISGVDTDSGKEYICDTCLEDDYFKCNDCGIYARGNNAYTDDCNREICQDCYEDNYFECDSCGDVRHRDNYGGDGCCDSCYMEDSAGCNRPNGWPYFKIASETTELYFGVELEVGFDDHPNFRDLLNDNASWAYNTEDSSVDADYNIEWLICPMTWAYIKKNKDDIKRFLQKSKGEGGYACNNAGMHIHLSKDAFDGYKHIYKFFKMIHNNRDYFEEISGRSYGGEIDEWASFVPLRNRTPENSSEDDMNSAIGNISKHTAVNSYHRDTLETRFFASTLDIDKYIDNIETLYNLYNFTKDYDFDMMSIDTFKGYIKENKEVSMGVNNG